jgi:signal peptidase I
MLWTVLFLIAMTCVRMSLSIAERCAEKPHPNLRTTGEILESFIIAVVVVFLVIRPFLVQTFYIPSHSMTPTLQLDDRILVNKLSYRFSAPGRNEVVVFTAPKEATLGDDSPEDETFVKRVVALEGEVVEVHNGTVYVNNHALNEPFLKEPIDYDLPPMVVPPGKLFVLGDNRNHSNDSHRWGMLDRSRLIGRAVLIFWPPSRAGQIQ